MWPLFVLCIIFSGCQTLNQDQRKKLRNFDQPQAYQQVLTNLKEPLEKENWEVASREINQYLQDNPRQPFLHIVNGRIYEKMSEGGQSEYLELAGVAYKTALSLDASNWHAAYYLGCFELRSKNYQKAIDLFAKALLLRPNDVRSWLNLAYASYYSYDIILAMSAIEKALTISPQNSSLFQAAAIIYAAGGQFDQSKKYRQLLQNAHTKNELTFSENDVRYLDGRIKDWENFYHVHKASFEDKPFPSGEEDGDEENASEDEGEGDQVKKLKNISFGQSLIIDCYLLSINEESSSSKGSNLLEAFENGLTIANGFGKVVTRTISNSAGESEVGPFVETVTKEITAPLTWEAINYNINILNSFNKRIEIMTRSTLNSYLGIKSTFRSGDIIKGGVGNDSPIVVDIPTGTVIDVTPIKVEGNKVLVQLRIDNSLLKNPVLDGKSLNQQTVSISQTRMDTLMEIEFNHTGMMGGLCERTDIWQKSGVPGLQALPGIQYLFSRESTGSRRRSILFLITPRRPNELEKQTLMHLKNVRSGLRAHNVKALVKRKILTLSHPPSLGSILVQLAPLYNEFRSGDIMPPYWEDQINIGKEIRHFATSLYY